MMAYVLPRVLSEAPEFTVEHVSIGESPISVLMNGDIDLLIGEPSVFRNKHITPT